MNPPSDPCPRERRVARDGLFITELKEEKEVLFHIPVTTPSGQQRLFELRASMKWAAQLKTEIDRRVEHWLAILEEIPDGEAGP